MLDGLIGTWWWLSFRFALSQFEKCELFLVLLLEVRVPNRLGSFLFGELLRDSLSTYVRTYHDAEVFDAKIRLLISSYCASRSSLFKFSSSRAAELMNMKQWHLQKV